MRQELLDAYWDVVREGLTFKEAADRRGVNRGTVCALNSLDAATAEMSNVHSLAEKPDHSREAL